VTAFTQPIEGSMEALATGIPVSQASFNLVGNFNWPLFLMASSGLTMFMGNLAALSQVSIKRILAYSSIAHAGYMLMGISTQSTAGIYAILFYVMVYCFMNIGAFWIASKVDDVMGGDHLKHFRGLVSRKPFYAISMAVFLFSLVGIPPFAGFMGKLYLFRAVIGREMYFFGLIAAINSVISLYYYMKIVKAMFFDAPEVEMPAGKTAFDSRLTMTFIALLVIPNIMFGLFTDPLMALISEAARIFTGS